MIFHIGQRVRIIEPGPFHGCEGTVVSELTRAPLIGPHGSGVVDAYSVDVDGYGPGIMVFGKLARFGFEPKYLVPLVDPDVTTKQWYQDLNQPLVETEHG